ncbi:BolA family protein [Kangiella sp. TOML190]|uniref:BolA family protein n=1 Tax=Kangiella sp. TOML190 TaxID=2931351 RepID=UPI00203F6211|nr:BolA/IbaG family iron-sulfur metabolism protein [Kangiella sp. TOML190]
MIETIEQLIKAEIDCQHLTVEGDGSHFSVVVVSEAFADLRSVKRQQLVYGTVNEHIASGAIHALTIKAYTDAEWQKVKHFQ